MIVALGSGDVHVVSLDLDLWVDELEGFLGGFNLRHTDLGGSEKESVHVGKLDLVVVVQNELSDAAACEHLRSNRANSSNTDNQDALVSDFLNR